MANTELASFIGWVDLSDDDLKNAREYLRSLSEGTVDELGFGIIRDSFADRFFPGTSTVHSYAKYFTLVPAIYLCVLEHQISGNAARTKCDWLEQNLRDFFRETNQIAGRQAVIKNMPASDYWPSLKRLGIYQAVGSQSQYFENLSEYLSGQQTSHDDDKNTHVESTPELWDSELRRLYDAHQIQNPDLQSGFSDTTNISLNRHEANYLKRKFVNQPHDPFPKKDSIIAYALQLSSFQRQPYPWQWPFPATMNREVGHAEFYSIFAKIATLLYYEMIIRKRAELKIDESTDTVLNTIEKWWDSARQHLLDWDLSDFIDLIDERKCNRDDTKFLCDFFAEIESANSANTFVQSTRAKKLVTERERSKRPQKRRLAGGRLLKDWRLSSNGTSKYFTDEYQIRHHFDYRAGIAARIVGEIFEGLGN